MKIVYSEKYNGRFFNEDLSFMPTYLNLIGMSNASLAKKIGISSNYLNKCFFGISTITISKFNEILKVFNVNSYDDLKKLATNEFQKDHTISFLKNYLDENNISYAEFSKVLGIHEIALNSYLEGVIPPKRIIDDILSLFDSKSLVDLRKDINNIETPKKLTRSFDISFMESYILKNTKLKNELIKELDVSKQLFSFYLKGTKIKENKLKIILEKMNVNSYQELKDKIDFENNHSKDLSFFFSYLKENGYSVRNFLELTDLIDIYDRNKSVGKIIKNKQVINGILNYFNLETTYELYKLVKTGEIEKLLISERSYDISFLRKYIDDNNINQSEFARRIGLTRQLFNRYLTDVIKIKESKLINILNYFEVGSYEELKELCESEKIDNNLKKYDISFLEEFIKNNNISLRKLKEEKDLDIYHYFNNKNILVSDFVLSKILEVLKVESYEELKEKCNNNTINIPSDILSSYDVSMLKEYLEYNNESIMNFSKEIKMPYSQIYNLLNKKVKIREQTLIKILSYFGFDSYEELVHKCLIYKNLNKLFRLRKSLIIMEKIENNNLNNYIYNNKFDISNYDYERLSDILEKYNVDEKYKEIIMLIFSNKFTINEISFICKINQKEIIKIYDDVTKIYLSDYFELVKKEK